MTAGKFASLITTVSLAAGSASISFAQDADPNEAVFACIRDNAVRVEQAFESLTEAVTFLVDSVCAKPVADAARIVSEAEEAARKARIEELCAGTENADPFDTAASQLAGQCQSREFMDVYMGGETMGYSTIVRLRGGLGAAGPEATSLASSLLLDARLARLAAQGE